MNFSFCLFIYFPQTFSWIFCEPAYLARIRVFGVLIHYFFILTFLFLACPIPVLAPTVPSVTPTFWDSIIVREGTTETMTFHVQWSSDLDTEPIISCTMKFYSMTTPFWSDDKVIPEGLKVPSQLDRFKIRRPNMTDQSLSVDLTIQNCCRDDEDIYQLVVVIFGNPVIFSLESTLSVQVFSPPGKATCFIALSTLTGSTTFTKSIAMQSEDMETPVSVVSRTTTNYRSGT